jgi:hypothetical protein
MQLFSMVVTVDLVSFHSLTAPALVGSIDDINNTLHVADILTDPDCFLHDHYYNQVTVNDFRKTTDWLRQISGLFGVQTFPG